MVVERGEGGHHSDEVLVRLVYGLDVARKQEVTLVDVYVARVTASDKHVLLGSTYAEACSRLGLHGLLHYHYFLRTEVEVLAAWIPLPVLHRAVIGDGDHALILQFDNLVHSAFVLVYLRQLLQPDAIARSVRDRQVAVNELVVALKITDSMLLRNCAQVKIEIILGFEGEE